jgi:hypothetical protein
MKIKGNLISLGGLILYLLYIGTRPPSDICACEEDIMFGPFDFMAQWVI